MVSLHPTNGEGRPLALRPLLASSACAIALVLAYLPTFAHALEVWGSDSEFSFAYLAPPVALALLWVRRNAFLVPAPRQGARLGAALAIAGAVVLVVSTRLGIHALAGLSFWPVTLGVLTYLSPLPSPLPSVPPAWNRGRYARIIALLLLTALGVFAVRTPSTATPSWPSPISLTAASGWGIAGVDTASTWQGTRYAQWVLARTGVARAGVATAYLYVERTAAAQTMLRWSGELGYVGAGYSIDRRSVVRAMLADGESVPVALAVVRNLSDRRVVLSVAMRPGQVLAHGSDYLAGTLWSLLIGSNGPYTLVRVSVASASPQGDTTTAKDAALLMAHAIDVIRAMP